MDQEIRDLIVECIRHEQELGLLTPVILSLNPSWNVQETGKENGPTKARVGFGEKWNISGGWDKVKLEYSFHKRELEKRLSDLAELLEEEGFEIEKFRSRVTEGHFGWLLSQKGRIKKHLRGIDVGRHRGE